MTAKSIEKLKRIHIGQNVQRVRMYFGVKQEALAANLGINQQEISRIEQQDKIEEETLSQIADALGTCPEVIKDFDVESTINNINNIGDDTFEQSSPSITQQFHLFEKIIELYERLLQSEREKVILLRNR